MIESYHFGSMTVGGRKHRNDLKIIGADVVGNWWRKEGHALYSEDISDILSGDLKMLVVGTGAYGGMKVTAEAAEDIEAQGIKMIAAPTKEAVVIFNSLYSEGEKVAGAFHLTC
jgi:hypothetical protein